MELFREVFSGFDIHNFEIATVNINEENADVTFDINYTANIEGGNESIDYAGIGDMLLKNENGYWCINKINLPGLIL